MTDYELALEIARQVDAMGGTAYFVGGYVRDQILAEADQQKDLKLSDRNGLLEESHENDIDLEIHGVTREQLIEILASHGEVVETGADYGVYGLKDSALDLALPRRERATGKGHKDFQVTVDPFLGTKEAASRRDFTINAMMRNVLTGEIVDHYGGLQDLRDHRIRHVNDKAFAEDPLRLFRGAQFAARFSCIVAEETIVLCQTMDVSTLAKERVFGEMKKALLKSDRPSIFFQELRKMNQLSLWFPELLQLKDVQQNPRYHQEGNVWNHTMMVMDEAAKRRHKVKEPLAFMLSALCHDYGKAVTTTCVDGEIHSYFHEKEGIPLVHAFLMRLSGERQLMDYVENMVFLHMKPYVMALANCAIRRTNKLFDSSVEPGDLIQLAESDAAGAINDVNAVSLEPFLQERKRIYEEYMSRPYVMGRDLIQAGLKPGANFSDILDYAHKLRLAGIEKEEALKQTLGYARRLQ